MTGFRKLLFALAVILVATVTASAQVNVSCQVSAVTPTVRAEGLTELVGDVLLNCTGAAPTAAGQPVPRMNLQIFLNTNVTSRLVSDPGSEAVLMVDEPVPANQYACGYDQIPAAGYRGVGGTGLPYATSGNDGTTPTPLRVCNVYQGRNAAANSIAWWGVPIDPPGTTASRFLRIKNVRANANMVTPTGTLVPTQLFMYVATTDTPWMTLNTNQVVVGYAVSGLSVAWRNACSTDSLASAGAAFFQCSSVNSDLAASPTASFSTTAFRVRFTEGFPSAFKKRNVATTPTTPTATAAQAVPTGVDPATGLLYYTETGWYNPTIPYSGSERGIRSAGLADHGTRLRVLFSGIPSGVVVYAGTRIAATTESTVVHLVTTDTLGAGAYFATPATSADRTDQCGLVLSVAPVTITAGTGVAVWEVVDTNPLVAGRFEVPIVIAYKASPPTSPALGTGSASASFAPISTVGTQSTAVAPVPRFADTGTLRSVIVIHPCQTNLLFPFVSNQAGFDTGIAIANTSRDPFGTTTQAGTCTLNYYGVGPGGGAAPSPQTSATVAAGDTMVFTLSAGGPAHGVLATPGFQGYIIAQCRFQYAHGFAFISDLGAANVSHGYLALVLDSSFQGRSGVSSEGLHQ